MCKRITIQRKKERRCRQFLDFPTYSRKHAEIGGMSEKVFELERPDESKNNNSNWQLGRKERNTINERLEGLKFLLVPAPIRRSF
jgi:hypothetical protein